MNFKPVITIILICFAIGLAGAYIVETWVINNTGQITILTYLTPYVDTTVWTNGSNIDWGTVEPDSQYYVNLTVVNVSPTPVTVYTRNTGLPTYLLCIWTMNNTVLAPDAAAVGNLTLTVDVAAPQGASFSFETFVHADGGA